MMSVSIGGLAAWITGLLCNWGDPFFDKEEEMADKVENTYWYEATIRRAQDSKPVVRVGTVKASGPLDALDKLEGMASGWGRKIIKAKIKEYGDYGDIIATTTAVMEADGTQVITPDMFPAPTNYYDTNKLGPDFVRWATRFTPRTTFPTLKLEDTTDEKDTV